MDTLGPSVLIISDVRYRTFYILPIRLLDNKFKSQNDINHNMNNSSTVCMIEVKGYYKMTVNALPKLMNIHYFI